MHMNSVRITFWFCPGVPAHKRITIVLSLFRSHCLAVVYCLVLCSGSCVPVHEDRTKQSQTLTTHNANRHCRVRFYTFVGQPLLKQLCQPICRPRFCQVFVNMSFKLIDCWMTLSVDAWLVCQLTLDWDLKRYVAINNTWCTGQNVRSIGVLLTIARILIERGYSWNFRQVHMIQILSSKTVLWGVYVGTQDKHSWSISQSYFYEYCTG